MRTSKPTSEGDQADAIADDYAERVLRNEARLEGLETLFAETRKADGNLVEQRSDSLLELVTARADAVLALGREERDSDRREVATITSEADRRGQLASGLLREVLDTAIRQNYEQSREAINALEQRRAAATDKLEQMVRQWRDSDREARELFATELSRHLGVLNHNNERMAAFQANSVTRELWQAEKDASMSREGILRDQIIALDKVMLTMTSTTLSDKAHIELQTRFDTAIDAASKVLDNKIEVVTEKVAELKSYRDTTTGRSSGYSSVYGWAVAGITVLISIIVLANAFISR